MITPEQKFNIGLNAIAKLLLGFRNQYRGLLGKIDFIKTYNIPEYDFLLDLKKIILYELQTQPELQKAFDKLDSKIFTYERLYGLTL